MEKPPPLEFWLLKLLLLNDDRVEWLEARLNLEWVRHAAVRQLIRIRFELSSNGPSQGVSAMVGSLEDAGLRRLAAEAASEDRVIPDSSQQLKDVVTRLRNKDADRRLGEVTRRLAEPDLTGDELESLIGERQALASIKGRPLEPLQGEGQH